MMCVHSTLPAVGGTGKYPWLAVICIYSLPVTQGLLNAAARFASPYYVIACGITIAGIGVAVIARRR